MSCPIYRRAAKTASGVWVCNRGTIVQGEPSISRSTLQLDTVGKIIMAAMLCSQVQPFGRLLSSQRLSGTSNP